MVFLLVFSYQEFRKNTEFLHRKIPRDATKYFLLFDYVYRKILLFVQYTVAIIMIIYNKRFIFISFETFIQNMMIRASKIENKLQRCNQMINFSSNSNVNWNIYLHKTIRFQNFLLAKKLIWFLYTHILFELVYVS